MANIIIIVLLAVILFFALRSSVSHFKGEGSCCGGGSDPVPKKKLRGVISKKTFSVEGMSCQHCVNRVTQAVNSIEGASASVSLKKGTVTVSMDRVIEDEKITDAITKAGYSVKKNA